MASANPRPTTSRKVITSKSDIQRRTHALTIGQSPFTPPSAKPAGVKKQNTKTSTPKASPAGTKKGGNRTITAKPSPANGNKRNTKAKANSTPDNKVKKPRAQPGTTGTRKKQKVDTVDNSEVIDISEEPAPQSFFNNQHQLRLLPTFETPTHPRHEQQVPYHMAYQQLSSHSSAQPRPMDPRQLQLPMASQQWSTPLQQPLMSFGQPTPSATPRLPPFNMPPQQQPASAQQHLSSILAQQPSTPPPHSPSDVFSQLLPFDMPPRQGPEPPQSPPISIASQDHPTPSQQHSSGMPSQQRSMQSQQEPPAVSPSHHLMPLKQLSSNMGTQKPSSMDLQQPQSALERQQRTPALVPQQPSSEMHSHQPKSVPKVSRISNKLDPEALNTADTASFDQLVLYMIKYDPILSPEQNRNAVTSKQLSDCAYKMWDECLHSYDGKLILQAAMYGSMYQDVKIRALGMMNVLPGWWFIREKIKQWLKTSDKWVDDKEMEEQFDMSCARAKRIIESRRSNKKENEEEHDDARSGHMGVRKDGDEDGRYE